MKRFVILSALVVTATGVAGAQVREPAGANSTLASLVAELGTNSPEIAAARREVDMRSARIAPAGTPPDPTLSIGYMSGFARPPFFPSSATPNAFRQVGVSQEIPYPGKLSLRSRIAAIEADAARWSVEDTRLQLAAELKVRPAQVQAAVDLLDGGATVPFIARYRKEATGALDDVQLRQLEERLGYLRELEERRAAVLEAIESQGKLTPALKSSIEQAETKQRQAESMRVAEVATPAPTEE